MNIRLSRPLPLALAGAITLALALPAGAAQPGRAAPAATPASVDASPLSPAERGAMARELILKWGYYVQRVYDVPVDTWAERMVPNLIHADPANFRAALQRDTYEGAISELAGTGDRMPDEAVITALAKAGDGDGTLALGALGNDLVYTPVAPCRIFDTRVAGGAIAANSTRNFIAINASNFTAQGGSATNCGTLGLSATAVAINLTAVTPSIAGYATAYPFGTAQPLASSINYTAGAVVNNALIVQIPNPLGASDLTVYTFGQSHFVADIVGYFAPPVATPVQCVETANTDLVITANGTGNASAPACAAGYTQTATNCETTSWLMPIVYFQSGTCSARNNDSTSQTLRASRTCCRVPGR